MSRASFAHRFNNISFVEREAKGVKEAYNVYNIQVRVRLTRSGVAEREGPNGVK